MIINPMEYQALRDYNTKLLSISSAATIAVVAYAQTGADEVKSLLIIGLALLSISLVAQILSSFLTYLMAKEAVAGNKETLEWARTLLNPVMKGELLFAILGITSAYLFVGINLI